MRLRQRIAANIRHLRREKGWSQEELAARAGIHRTYMGAVERSEKSISADVLEKLGEALEVDAAVLLTQAKITDT